MRRVSILLVVLFAVFALHGQEPTAPPSLRFEQEVWDFGRIQEVDGKVSHTFTYRNEADHAVAIERVYSSCGCTTGEYSRRPLKAGAQGTFSVTFDPEGRSGKIDKSITLVYDQGRGRTTLHIKGRVKARPRSVADEFPYDLGGGLRSDASYRAFGRVAQGTTRSMTIALLNNSQQSMDLRVDWELRSGLLEVAMPDKLEPQERALITLTYAPENNGPHYGLHNDTFFICANEIRAEVAINTSVIGIDNFEGENESDARAKITPVYHDLHPLKRGESGSSVVEISNTGSEPLVVRAVTLREGTQFDLRAGEVIAPGETLQRQMSLTMPMIVAESFIGGAMVVLNDPHKPVRELKIAAQLAK